MTGRDERWKRWCSQRKTRDCELKTTVLRGKISETMEGKEKREEEGKRKQESEKRCAEADTEQLLTFCFVDTAK